MSSIKLCLNTATSALSGVRGVVAKVPFDGSRVTEFVNLQVYGKISDISISCTNFTLNYTGGEVVTKIDAYYD